MDYIKFLLQLVYQCKVSDLYRLNFRQYSALHFQKFYVFEFYIDNYLYKIVHVLTFGGSFYQCKWYNVSQDEIKLMQIFMMRSANSLSASLPIII
ncbi:odorant receptor 4-like [Vespula maculifrons]|uniref:Odorant receptor 4-like n=1 Tax=Vespula maculifrons TaxID=7453 RepID=A0ABD2BR45_VESMC